MARAHLLSALCRAPAQCKVWLEGGSQESRNKRGKLPSLGGWGGRPGPFWELLLCGRALSSGLLIPRDWGCSWGAAYLRLALGAPGGFGVASPWRPPCGLSGGAGLREPLGDKPGRRFEAWFSQHLLSAHDAPTPL